MDAKQMTQIFQRCANARMTRKLVLNA